MLPVVGRELLVSARRPASYWTRSAFVGLLLLLVAVLAWSPVWALSVGRQGVAVFSISAMLLFFYSLFSGIILTADCLSSERREGTLALLFLTDLKASHVVLGKMICSSIHGFYFFLAVVPALSLGFLFGGIEWPLVFLMLAVLLSTLLVSLEFGVFVSSRSLIERKAMMGTLLVLGLWAIGPLIIEQLTVGRFVFDVLDEPEQFTIGFLSPLTQVLAVAQTAAPVPEKIVLGIVGSQLVGLLLLRQAARRLSTSKTGDEASNPRKPRAQSSRSDRQHSYRARLLEEGPTMWLTARQPFKAHVAVLFSFTILAIVGFSWVLTNDLDGRLSALILGIWCITVFFKIWVLFEACQRSFEDRQSGALELLLTTPLAVPEMASGFHRALRNWFRVALLLPCLGFVCCLFFLAPNLTFEGLRDGIVFFLAAAVMGGVDLWALSWIGLWEAARSRSTLRAIGRAVLVVFGIPFIASILVIMGERVVLMFVPSSEWAAWVPRGVYFGLSLVVSLLAGRSARRRYLQTLREVAAARFESRHQEKRVSIRAMFRNLPRNLARSPALIAGWIKGHPVWGGLGCLLVLLMVGQAARVWVLDRSVDERIRQIASSGWATNYSVFQAMRAQALAKGWREASSKLKDLRASYQEFRGRDALDAGFEPLLIPETFAPLPTNQVRLMRPHLARNKEYFGYAHALAESEWIDMSALEGVPSSGSWYLARSLTLRSQDFGMLMWQGMLAVEDQNLKAAVDIIEQMLKLARVSMRAHRLMGLYPARTSFTQAARLTERIVATGSPDTALLRQLRTIWEIEAEATSIEPEVRQAFAEIVRDWTRPIHAEASRLSRQQGTGLVGAQMILATEHITGRHQRSTLYSLNMATNLPHWNSLLTTQKVDGFSFRGDGAVVGFSGSPHFELLSSVSLRREILGQARAVRIGLALREQQLDQPAAGKSAWMLAVTNQPALKPFAQAFNYVWETNGFIVRMNRVERRTRLARGRPNNPDLRFEVRRRDWVKPVP